MSKQLSCRWIETKLGEICEKITDGAHLSPNSVDDGFPMASVKDLNSFGINIETCRKISQTDYKKLVHQGCQPQKDDVLIAKDGATALDTVSLVKKPLDVVLLSSVAILRPNKDKIVPLYLRYYLESTETRAYMKNAFISGAAIPRVILKDFKQAKINMPPVLIQSKIVSILSAYDDLIENNLRRIKILEEMVQNLYREWFVNFRFPGHEQTRFVDSPLGRIPEGWEVLEFRNLFDIKYGKTLPKTKIFKHGLYPVYGAGDIIGYYDQMICEKKCVLVTSRGNGSGTVWRTRGAAFITNNSLIIKPKPGFNHWDYTFIELLLKNSNVMEAKTGSAQPQVTIENLNYVKGLVPESKCVERFCAIALPIYEFIDRCLINNNILYQTRDLLLPKLISGEVDVSEIDIKVPEEEAV